MKRLRVLVVIFAVCVLPVFAETVLKAEADKTSISTDEVVTYTVSITSTDRSVPVPSLPAFDDFSVLSSVRSSSSTFQKGALKISVVYSFVLAPRKTGTLTIKPVTLAIGKEECVSDTLKIEVKEGSRVPVSPKSRSDPSLPETDLPESDEPQYIL